MDRDQRFYDVDLDGAEDAADVPADNTTGVLPQHTAVLGASGQDDIAYDAYVYPASTTDTASDVAAMVGETLGEPYDYYCSNCGKPLDTSDQYCEACA